MKRYLLPLIIFTAALAPAQEADTALKSDINELQAQSTARQVLQLQQSLADAFSTPAYLKQLETALSEWDALSALDRDLTLSESAVQAMNAAGYEPRDIDTAALLSRISELLEDKAEAQRLNDKRILALAERVHKGMIPVVKRRERGKEQALLAANAERPEVSVLSNGVQMEVLPGESKLSEVNRITTETGLTSTLYNRTTRRVQFAELPEPIQAVAKEVPAGKAWVFWIPAEVAAARRLNAADTAARRSAALNALSEMMGAKSTAEKDAEAESNEDRAILQKIVVWKDDPDAPIQALPDTRSLTE